MSGAFFFHYRSLLILVGIGLLMILAIKKLRSLWPERTTQVDRKSSFQIKMARAFALFVMIPCCVLAVLSIFFLNIGMNTWFNRQVQTAISRSGAIAKQYLKEQQRLIQFQSLTLMDELKKSLSTDYGPLNWDFTSELRAKCLEILNQHEALQQLHSMIFFCDPFDLSQEHSSIKMTNPMTSIGGSWLSTLSLTRRDLVKAKEPGGFIRFTQDFKHLLHIVPLDFYPNTFTVMCRSINPTILERVSETNDATETYDAFLKNKKYWMPSIIAVIIFFTIVLILIAMIGGLSFSQQTIRPISALIQASEQVKQGYAPLIPIKDLPATHELLYLIHVFNSMSAEVSAKTEALNKANAHLHNRNLFIESVLEGISSGVMSLDRQGTILFANTSAAHLFPHEGPLQGQNILVLVPEFLPLFQQALRDSTIIHSDPVTLSRGHHMRTFRLHIQCLVMMHTIVMTMDDISTLIAAQKKSAWSDVACRIAHEVKNPLTPIALSAERLRRRYLKEIDTEPEIFEDCIDTIIRQVNHIGNLISEFSDFARLPMPRLEHRDLNMILSKMIVLLQQAYPTILFNYRAQNIYAYCDAQQIEQVLNNVFKNAIEAIQETKRKDGVITTTVETTSHWVVLSIEDNGMGLSSDKALVLCEPYHTTKEHGMGLGLAIVQKIIDDHGGLFAIHPCKNTVGACVTISLLKDKPLSETKELDDLSKNTNPLQNPF